MNIPAEAAKLLAAIENKYDIFFVVNNRNLTDYFDIDLQPCFTLRLKQNEKLPFTLVNDLRQHFYLIER